MQEPRCCLCVAVLCAEYLSCQFYKWLPTCLTRLYTQAVRSTWKLHPFCSTCASMYLHRFSSLVHRETLTPYLPMHIQHTTDSFASLQLGSPTLLVVYVAREEAVRLMQTASRQVSITSALSLWAVLLPSVIIAHETVHAYTLGSNTAHKIRADIIDTWREAVTTATTVCWAYVGWTIDPVSSLHSFSLSFYLPRELPTSILDRMALVRHICYKWVVIACILLPSY